MNLEDKLNSVNKSIQSANEKTIGRVVSIPIEKVKENPENFYDVDIDIENLVESIKEFEVIHPIVITEDYMLISGHRRLRASKLAGLKEIPAMFDNSNENYDLKLIEANRQRIKSNAEIDHEIEVLEKYYKNLKSKNASPKGRIRNLVAKDLGISEATVARRISSRKNKNTEDVVVEVSPLDKDVKSLKNKCNKVLENIDNGKYNVSDDLYILLDKLNMMLKDKSNFTEVDNYQMILDDFNN